MNASITGDPRDQDENHADSLVIGVSLHTR